MSDAAEKTKALLSKLWEKNLPVLQERLAELDHAAEANATHTLTTPTRESAAATAHKLAGSLGMFGYPEATELSRKIEQLLETGEPVDPLVLRELATCLRTALNL